MKRKPRPRRLDGVLLVDKPQGWTSHDVVARVRQLTGERRVGHTGTLDPHATGLLLLALGRGTKLASFMTSLEKTYEGEIALGIRTTTDDTEGDVLDTRPVPEFGDAELRALEQRFSGSIEQVPPAFSAVKVGGKRSYALARKGELPELKPRTVQVRELHLWKVAPDRLGIRVTCSAGTYVRALARDIGDALGCGGHLAHLTRTRIGRFHLSQAVTMEELEEAAREGRMEQLVLPIDEGVASYDAAIVTRGRAIRLAHGETVEPSFRPWLPSECARLYDAAGTFIGMGRVLLSGHIRPVRIVADVD